MVDVTPANPAPAAAPADVLLSRGDRIGMFGSLLCAIHCALLPLVIAVLPTLGLGSRPCWA